MFSQLNLSLRNQLLLLVSLTGISRIPFIFDGYGVEEDSWGLVVNSYEIQQTGHFVASRLPGHPVQEWTYALIYDQPAWMYNSLSVLFSMIAVFYFFKVVHQLGLASPGMWTLAFACTPVFYIAGTYTIDYAWVLGFLLASLYYLLRGHFIVSGILLGMTIGLRVTTGAFLLPWLLLVWNNLDTKTSIKHFLHIAVPAGLIGIAWYIPVYLVYGAGFFDYSDQFPYPPFTKILYKASIGVFGLLGCTAIAYTLYCYVRRRKSFEWNGTNFITPKRLVTVCLVVIGIHILAYLRLPQKSAYMLPLVPFVIILCALVLQKREAKWFALLFAGAPFLMSMNLTDPLRGAEHSALAATFKISGQEIFIDPISGPIFSERSKRINKMKYCDEVLKATDTITRPTVIIGGWWYNELITENFKRKYNKLVRHRFYIECHVMDSARRAGAQVFYLPEQNLYNDQMYGQQCTDSLAQPFYIR